MVLLLCLFVTVITGLAAHGSEGHGLLKFIDPRYEYRLEKIHVLFANLTLGLVGVHILGVLVESVIHRENLIRAMFHGNKKQ